MYTVNDIVSRENYRDFKNLVGSRVYAHDNVDELLEIANSEETDCILTDINLNNGEYCFTVETPCTVYIGCCYSDIFSKYIIVVKEN